MPNLPPEVDLNGSDPGTGNSIAYTENGPATKIAPAATVTDSDSPDFDGGSLTVEITSGAGPNDQFRVLSGGSVIVSEQDILYRVPSAEEPFYQDLLVGTISGGTDGSTPMVISFTDQATPSIVQEITRLIAFVNFSDAPVEGQRTVTLTLTDGDGGTSTPVTATVALTATDDPTVLQNDSIFTQESHVVTGSVFADNGNGPDLDPDGPITVTAVNDTGPVGQPITLASGARVQVNANGTFGYDPNHAFDYLAAASTGAANSQATDTFTYSVGASTATVTVTISGESSPGDVLEGDENDNFIVGTENADLFNVSQGGSDTVSGNGGNDYFYFGGAFSAGDSVDGGEGTDVVALLGNYNMTLNSTSLIDVERLTLFSASAFGNQEGASSYAFTSVDGNVGEGHLLVVLGSFLLANETLFFNGMAETDGTFQLYGGAAADTLVGGHNNDSLVGNAGADQLYGMDGDDWIAGGAGADTIRGGHGADLFVYRSVSDSGPGSYDMIADFEDAQDRINLEKIDADGTISGDQTFTFVGSNAFSHTPGELRAFQLEGATWQVEGDVDGDGVADLVIQLNVFNGHVMTASDFVL